MMKVIWGLDTEKKPGLMERIWRFRHRQFVDRLGWNLTGSNDGREIDQFDTPSAIHLPLVLDNEVVGYSRLLPTTEPHLLSDVYPELMSGGEWPRSATVYEWTRCVAVPDDLKIGEIAVSKVLMTGVIEFCVTAGISSLIVETHPKLVNLLISTGWEVTVLSDPKTLDGQLLVPINARPSICGLLQHRALYRIGGSVLELDGAERNPLRPAQKLTGVPFVGSVAGHHPSIHRAVSMAS